MELTPFTRDHLPLIEGWMAARGKPIVEGGYEYLPRVGFISDRCVAGFLYRTDAPAVAYVDGFVGDPHVLDPVRMRNAMRALGKALTDEARALGLRVLNAHSAVPSIIDAAEANGWTLHVDRPGATFLSIDLGAR